VSASLTTVAALGSSKARSRAAGAGFFVFFDLVDEPRFLQISIDEVIRVEGEKKFFAGNA